MSPTDLGAASDRDDQPPPGQAPPTLALGDPLSLTAVEDLDSSWGDLPEGEAGRADRYLSERPPHHGD